MGEGIKSQAKDRSVESLRGLAILLLVSYHCKGVGGGGNPESVYDHFGYSLEYVRMPLFTVISGFVYAIRPAQANQWLTFLTGKARRVLLPFLAVMTLWLILGKILPVSPDSLASQFAYPGDSLRRWAHFYLMHPRTYWFLQAVFIVFVIVGLADMLGLMRSLARWLICLGVAFLASLFVPRHELFSWDGAMYLLPYFVLGLGLYRYADALKQRWVLAACGAITLLGLAVHEAYWYGWDLGINMDKTGSVLSICVGLCSGVLLFGYRRKLPVLGWLGTYAYAIYLLHRFAFQLMFAVHEHLVPNLNRHVVFLAFLSAGLLLPIAAERLILRSRWASLLLLGLRRRPRKKQGPAPSGIAVPSGR